jgi:hypothetical protein
MIMINNCSFCGKQLQESDDVVVYAIKEGHITKHCGFVETIKDVDDVLMCAECKQSISDWRRQ